MDLLGFQRGNIDHQPFVSWRNNPSAARQKLIEAENANANPFTVADNDLDNHHVKTALAL